MARPSVTRDRVRRLLDEGKTAVEIAALLGVNKSTVCYHRRRLGEEIDGRFARRYDWEAVQQYHDEGHSMTECKERFGFYGASWSQAVARGDIRPRPHAAPIETYLVSGRRVNRGHIKARLIKEGLKSDRCERCGLNEWLGEPLGLELHHVNGDGQDNRLENLMLLCGNCHSQTTNWGGRGLRSQAAARPAQSPYSRA